MTALVEKGGLEEVSQIFTLLEPQVYFQLNEDFSLWEKFKCYVTVLEVLTTPEEGSEVDELSEFIQQLIVTLIQYRDAGWKRTPTETIMSTLATAAQYFEANPQVVNTMLPT